VGGSLARHLYRSTSFWIARKPYKILFKQISKIQRWKRMGSGDPPGLQNRRAAGLPVAGAFDSHTLPPFIFNVLLPMSAQPVAVLGLGLRTV
jgi:hypothetical protein